MRDQRGFTLFELLIAATVVSILAVIALPMYLNYDVRARISEGFALAGPVKTMVVDYYQTTGNWPGSNLIAGLGEPDSYKTDNVESISVGKNGPYAVITITYRIPALGADNTIILSARGSSNNVLIWSCKLGTILNKYRPASCRA